MRSATDANSPFALENVFKKDSQGLDTEKFFFGRVPVQCIVCCNGQEFRTLGADNTFNSTFNKKDGSVLAFH